MAILLNSFSVEMLPTTLELPYKTYSEWEECRSDREQSFGGYRTHQFQQTIGGNTGRMAQEAITLVFLAGPSLPPDLNKFSFDLGSVPSLGNRLIEDSLMRQLRSRGFTVQRTAFERLAITENPAFSSDLVRLYSGVSFRARRPFSEQRYHFTLTVQWVAKALFAETLTNPTLARISSGLGVSYTPSGKPLPELLHFSNQFLGHVKSILEDGTHAIVDCRDYDLRSVALCDLTLEASPEAIRKYELITGSDQRRSTIWRSLQQLSKALTKEGRRNRSVLRDRLNAIRDLLGGGKDSLILPFESFSPGSITVSLSPLKVEVSD